MDLYKYSQDVTFGHIYEHQIPSSTYLDFEEYEHIVHP